MPKQTGIFKIDGTIGDVTFYKNGGKHYVRTKGGVSGDRIKNDPKFARTRENMAEFTHVAAMSKAIRKAIRPILEKAKDSKVSIRLNSKLREVMKSDLISNRGERKVTNGEVFFLKGFEFNNRGQLGNTFFGSADNAIDVQAKEIALESNFVPAADLNAPSGATHFMLSTAGLAINLAMPEDFELVTASSPMSAIGQDALQVSLSGNFNSDLTGNTLFQFILIEFYQEVNGKYYILKNGAHNCLQLVNIF